MNFPRVSLLLFAISPALVDIILLPLLILAPRRQANFDQLPIVARENQSANSDNDAKVVVIELTLDGKWKHEELIVARNQLLETVKTLPSEQRVCVSMECDESGHGHATELLQFTYYAQRLGVGDRLFVLSRPPAQQDRNPASATDNR